MATRKAVITVNRPREEVERLWREHDQGDGQAVSFRKAPGDRGTEIHLEIEQRGGKLGEAIGSVVGAAPLAKARDELRHFKQLVETGEIARSDGVPEGEQVQRKFKQRPAQPLPASERQEVGV